MRAAVVILAALVACGHPSEGGPDAALGEPTTLTADAQTQADAGAPSDAADDAEAGPGGAPADTAGDAAGADAPDAPAVPDAPPAEPPDPTGALFPAGRVLDVQLELDPAHWDALRLQTRSLLDVLGPGCLDAPAGSPFTWFPAMVTVDGLAVAQVGVRKKGLLGSMSASKPSLRVDFDRYVDGQALHGMASMTLNNCRQDPSLVRQCLSYAVFREAGVPAPRCAFAHVTVNGADLGVYASVEPIKKAFIRRWFVHDGGDLWEGTLSDLREGWLGTFEKKNHENDPDHVSLAAVAAALEAAPDEALADVIGQHVDLDAFLTFWATEVLLGHWDGYAGNTNNFYLYVDPADGMRLRFLPWGADATMQPGPSPYPPAVMATGLLARRIYLHPLLRKKYVARLSGVLAAAWDEDALLAEVDRLEGMLGALATDGAAFAQGLAEVRQFVAGRRAAIEADLEGGPPPWLAGLRDEPCAKKKGTLTAEVQTTWETLSAQNPFETGGGSFALALGGKAFPTAMVGVRAGVAVEGETPAQPELQVFAKTAGPDTRVLIVTLPPASLAPGAVIPIGTGGTGAVLYGLKLGEETPPVLLGMPGDGTLVLQSFGDAPGAPVSATVQATVYGW